MPQWNASYGDVNVRFNVNTGQLILCLRCIAGTPLSIINYSSPIERRCAAHYSSQVWMLRSGQALQRSEEINSDQLHTPEIVQMDHAFNSLTVVNHDQRCNLALFKHGQRFCREFIRADSLGLGVHGFTGSFAERRAPLVLQEPA